MRIGSNRTLRPALAALIVCSAALVGAPTSLNAAVACGEYSFSFEGTRLLNDGISDSAGPFTIAMPEGVYDITLRSFDDHADHPGQVEQTQEQWYFILDSGYTSPVSSDIPLDGNSTVDHFTNVEMLDATAISVHHLGEGGINSVSPMCVGFTPVANPAQPVVDVAPQIPPVEPEIESSHDTTDRASDVPVEVEPAIEINSPAPVAQLAITGPSRHVWLLLSSGGFLLMLGAALVLDGRRRTFES